MKIIFKLFCFMVSVMLIFGFGYLYGKQARHYPDPFKTVTEQMKSIQRQVGCKLIDGEVGTETMPLINSVVRAEKKAKKEQEEQELCNKYAVKSFARMAKEGKK